MSGKSYLNDYDDFYQKVRRGEVWFPDFSKYEPSPVINFLLSGHAHKGHTFLTILEEVDDLWLENTHDYIQWIYPLDEPSKSLRHAPVLTEQDIEFIHFNRDGMIILSALNGRMQRFWENNQHWVTGYNHNHLRITRAIKSLRLTLGDQHAEEFKKWLYRTLGKEISKISENSQQFWAQA